jgi:hypothetical protein
MAGLVDFIGSAILAAMSRSARILWLVVGIGVSSALDGCVYHAPRLTVGISTSEWRPGSHDFGTLFVGQLSPTVELTLTNAGSAPSTGCSAPALRGEDTTSFAIGTEDCGSSDLPPGGQCRVVVSARPVAAGTKNATLVRTCAAGGAPTNAVAGLTATGEISPAPAWIGAVELTPTGGAAGCTSLANGDITPGWCFGGTSVAMAVLDGALSNPSDITGTITDLYVADNQVLQRFDLDTGAFIGWLGAGGNPIEPRNPPAGSAACTGAQWGGFIGDWCRGGTCRLTER